MSRLQVVGTRRLGLLLLLLTLQLAARTPAAPAAPAAAPESVAPVAPAPAAVVSAAAPADDPTALPAELMPRASKSQLLDLVRTANGYFAVGERGHVLQSADGKAWTQLKTPTRSTLTAITAVDGQLWAAGHDGVIIHSADAGKTWQAQRRDPYQLAAGQSAADHESLQGAPILDLYFSDASNGIAVGAYSLMLVTHDGGATWTPRQAIAGASTPAPAAAPMEGDIFSQEDLQLDEESNPHLNAIASAGAGNLVIVGERGTLLRSSDGGQTWSKLGFPYKGSMFGVLSLGQGRLLAYGLRGNVYESADLGSSWHKVQTQASVSLMGGSALANGGAVLAGANGAVLSRTSADAPFTIAAYRNAAGEMPALSGIVATDDGGYMLTSDKGVDLYQARTKSP
jgi:photosystem II stability/assembly factor-like uncharacterized protein